MGMYVTIDFHSSLSVALQVLCRENIENLISIICHLKRLKDESRPKLHNRFNANENTRDTRPDVEQRMVQTMLSST